MTPDLSPEFLLRTLAAGISPACTAAVEFVLADPQFCTVPSSTGKHHYYKGGNLRHTYEVTHLACVNTISANSHRRLAMLPGELDLETVFLSAVLHDFGKIHAYEVDPAKDGHWRKTKDYTIQLHIEKSVETAKNLLTGKISQEKLEAVVHCIGAHHGKIEWGALWLPKTSEAWVVHLADMLSVFCVVNRKDS